jgi:hypothetical protein
MVNLARGRGIVLHATSLPERWGIEDLGPTAYQFVDCLKAAGQSWWQMLPLGQTGYDNSPYMCFPAFAVNPLFIGPEKPVEDGLVSVSDAGRPPPFSADPPWAMGERSGRLSVCSRENRTGRFAGDRRRPWCDRSGGGSVTGYLWFSRYANFTNGLRQRSHSSSLSTPSLYPEFHRLYGHS